MKTTLNFLTLLPSPEALTDPAAAKKHFEATKTLMTGLGGLLSGPDHPRLSLELVAKQGQVHYIIGAPTNLIPELTHHLYAALPTCELIPQDNWTVLIHLGPYRARPSSLHPPRANSAPKNSWAPIP
jgi:hypothetical protein